MLLFVLACTPDAPVPPAPDADPLVLSDLYYPTHPWGEPSIAFSGTPTEFGLDVVGPDGTPVEMDFWLDRGTVTWTPIQPLEPGFHIVRGALGVSFEALEFEVLPFGLDDAFEGLAPGDAFRIDPHSARFQPRGFGGLLLSNLDQDPVVEVLAVDGDTVDYRIVMIQRDGPGACSAHQGVATIQEGGRLLWDRERVDFAMDDTQLSVFDAAFDLPLWDGRVGGGSLDLLLDTEPLVPLVDPGGDPTSVCLLLGTFGWSCEPCPDGTGEDTCFPIGIDDMQGDRWETPWLHTQPLAPCLLTEPEPIELDIEIPPIDCAPISCSTHRGPAGGLGLALTFLVFARRRATP